MPALPVITNGFRCVLHWTNGAGQNAENVIHIVTDDPGKTTTDVFNVLDTNVATNMWGSIGNGAVISDVSITPLDGTSATDDFSTGSPAKWGGTGIGETIPGAACLVKFTTGFRGRSNRGRIYIPFLSEAAQGNGLMVGGTVSAMQPEWTDFLADLQADATTPCALNVISYKLGHGHPVTLATVEGVVATQRRRQGRLRSA